MSQMFVKVSLSNNFNKPVILSDGLQPSSPKVFLLIFFSSIPNQVAIISLLTICHPYCRHLSISFGKTQVDDIFGPGSVTFGSPLADVSGLVKPLKLDHRNTNEDTHEVGGDDFDLDEVDSDHGHQ